MDRDVSRRRIVLGAAGLASTAVAAGTGPASAAGAVREAAPAASPVSVRPGDSRYAELTTGVNRRWTASPGEVRLVRSTAEVRDAVDKAVSDGLRITVRGGGHCLADFVFHRDVDLVVDMSLMKRVYFDESRGAFAVEAGATLMDVYDTLYKEWGVTVPGGLCYSVGVGGHVSGGGFGLLSRQHGLTVDHLYAVEVVVVDGTGRVRSVVATREPGDPHRDLWWGCAGGGGGNFGVITRYWFRTPGTSGSDPGRLLVRPPEEVLVQAVTLPWDRLDARRFQRLLENIGAWYEDNSAPDSPFAALSGSFSLTHRAGGGIGMMTQIDATVPDAERLFQEYVDAITDGVQAAPEAATTQTGELGPLPELAEPTRLPWLRATRRLGTSSPMITDPAVRSDHHSAYLRRRLPAQHIRRIHDWLSSDSVDNPMAMVVINLVGGAIDRVGPDETAVAQRDAIFKLLYQSRWQDPADDAANIAWTSGCYRAVYAESGGVPVPNGTTDGCYINYPDTGVDDPDANTSGVSWHRLYHKGNYPRLQRVKARWDPRDIFHHRQSVELPGT
ncbi:FAD-binding oxidoreductase [Streptomyces sp. NBC_00878]|uniref:FAD-binding oxidoreductase n=1 Tax=Streptomyces sp. NBC_00878 TaxID=2975854 RepID=UPI00225920D8|nr:FAD-binding protein [Streptomyces sp. NBC_00878]MCX4906886.1 FAD-binding protein [Streptomyces sp. NBC_00878]